MDRPKYNDYPLEACMKKANAIIDAYPGTKIYQKFSCGGCGERLTIDIPNEFHERGSCDKCDFITDIRKQGCNYLVVYAAGVDLDKALGGKK